MRTPETPVSDDDKLITLHYSRLWKIPGTSVSRLAQQYWTRLQTRVKTLLDVQRVYGYRAENLIGGSKWKLLDQLVTHPFASHDIDLPNVDSEDTNIDHVFPIGTRSLTSLSPIVVEQLLSRHNVRLVWEAINRRKGCGFDEASGNSTDYLAAMNQVVIYEALHKDDRIKRCTADLQGQFLLSIQHDKSVERERLRYKQYMDEYYGRT